MQASSSQVGFGLTHTCTRSQTCLGSCLFTHVYTLTPVHPCTLTHVHTLTPLHTRACLFLFTHAHTPMHTHRHAHTCSHTSTCSHTLTNVCRLAHVHACAHACTCSHMCTHSHMCSSLVQSCALMLQLLFTHLGPHLEA